MGSNKTYKTRSMIINVSCMHIHRCVSVHTILQGILWNKIHLCAYTCELLFTNITRITETVIRNAS